MSERFFTTKCSGCGREIQVPAQLTEFSCVYCGHKMKLGQTPDGTHSSAFESAAVELVRCVSDHLDIHSQFGRQTYPVILEDYKAKHYPTFAALDRLMAASPEQAGEMAAAAAVQFVDGLEMLRQTEARYSKGHGGAGRFFDDMRSIMAIYTVPAALDMGLANVPKLVSAIHDEWCRRFPKAPFTVSTRDVIEQGFKRKLCFITTAVCEADGKPDDCEELALLRAFRDGYLRAQPDGPALIEEYYATAPMIVACIRLCDDSRVRLAQLREDYILPCVRDIRAGRLTECKDRYTEMMHTLSARYLGQ
ncbi:MAG: CFI-box-CTERM domain-containing protein [Oscillospiraceae bacterium]